MNTNVTCDSAGADRIGVLGLGIMGSAIATNLLARGVAVCGWDPLPAARASLGEAGGVVAADAAQVAASAPVLLTSLPGPAALMETARTLAHAAARGTVVIETSTLDIDDKIAARDLLEQVGVVMLDCPLSGTGAQARSRDLAVYASGPPQEIRRVVPFFERFARTHYDVGTFGNGMRMKLMANLLVAVHNVSTAEALLLGQRWGISPARAVEVLADGAGGSRMLQVRGPMMQDEGWTAATMKLSVWQKDMRLIAAALEKACVPAPLFSATVPIYNAALGLGHAEHDTASVFDVLRRMSSADPAG
ncbi:MAG: NAD(P)-dependent oxidoreductase [Lautropia sp.]